uniref:Cap-specific mRNA (nucleoside-2'-O-)-methyltransferase 1 n=1 Tax=Neospora caninum (strain Liverpool) TaxID=572307 RepID=A0A0F7U7L7_NEOCL|nr:TPA: ftsJ-like methyltransferase domain-containing protein, putative [Neospora caninum Liverpool]
MRASGRSHWDTDGHAGRQKGEGRVTPVRRSVDFERTGLGRVDCALLRAEAEDQARLPGTHLEDECRGLRQREGLAPESFSPASESNRGSDRCRTASRWHPDNPYAAGFPGPQSDVCLPFSTPESQHEPTQLKTEGDECNLTRLEAFYGISSSPWRATLISENEGNTFTASVPGCTQKPFCNETSVFAGNTKPSPRDGGDGYVRSSPGLKGASCAALSLERFATRGNRANDRARPSVISVRPNFLASQAEHWTGSNAAEWGGDLRSKGEREEEEANAARREMMEQMLRMEENDPGMAVGDERAQLLHRLLIVPQLEFFKIRVGAAPVPRLTSEATEGSFLGRNEPTGRGVFPVSDGGRGKATPGSEDPPARSNSQREGDRRTPQDDAKNNEKTDCSPAVPVTGAGRRSEKAGPNQDGQESEAILRATHGVFSRTESSAGPASAAVGEQEDRPKAGPAAIDGPKSCEKRAKREGCGASFGVFKADRNPEAGSEPNENRGVPMQVGASTDSCRFLSGTFCDADAVRSLWTKKTRLDSIFDEELDWLYRAARDFVFPRDGWSKKHLNRAGDKIEEICDALAVHCGLSGEVASFETPPARNPSSFPLSLPVSSCAEAETICGATHGAHSLAERSAVWPPVSRDLQQRKRVGVLLGCCVLSDARGDEAGKELGGRGDKAQAERDSIVAIKQETEKAKREDDSGNVVFASELMTNGVECRQPQETCSHGSPETRGGDSTRKDKDEKDHELSASLERGQIGAGPGEELQALQIEKVLLSTHGDSVRLPVGSGPFGGSSRGEKGKSSFVRQQKVSCSIEGEGETCRSPRVSSENEENLRVFVDICGGPGAWSLFLLKPIKGQAGPVLQGSAESILRPAMPPLLYAPAEEELEANSLERGGKVSVDDRVRSVGAAGAFHGDAKNGVGKTKDGTATEQREDARASTTSESLSDFPCAPVVCGFGMTLATGAADGDRRKARTLWYPHLAGNPRWKALWGADGTGNVYRGKNLAHGKAAVSRWVAEAAKQFQKKGVRGDHRGSFGDSASVTETKRSGSAATGSMETEALLRRADARKDACSGTPVDATAHMGGTGLADAPETELKAATVSERNSFVADRAGESGKESEQPGSQLWSQESLSTSASSDTFLEGSHVSAPKADVPPLPRPDTAWLQAAGAQGSTEAATKETAFLGRGDKNSGEARKGGTDTRDTPDTQDAETYQGVPHVCLVVADGGFHLGLRARTTPIDEKTGRHIENYQELLCARLLLSELLFALMLLEEGGNFVCKIFDTFTHFTRFSVSRRPPRARLSQASLVYIVARLFEDCAIIKPIRSRAANSERYLVGLRLKRRSSAEFRSLFDVVRSVHGMWERHGEVREKLAEDESPDSLVPVDVLTSDEAFVESLGNACRFLCKKQTLALDLIYRKYVELKASLQISAVLKPSADGLFRLPRLVASRRPPLPFSGGSTGSGEPASRNPRECPSEKSVSSAQVAVRWGSAPSQTAHSPCAGGSLVASSEGLGGAFAWWGGQPQNSGDSGRESGQRGVPSGVWRTQKSRACAEAFESWETPRDRREGLLSRPEGWLGHESSGGSRWRSSPVGCCSGEETDRESSSGAGEDADACAYADVRSASRRGAHVKEEESSTSGGSASAVSGGAREAEAGKEAEEGKMKTPEELYEERMKQLQSHHERRLRHKAGLASSGRRGGRNGPREAPRESRDLPPFNCQGQSSCFAEFPGNSLEANLLSLPFAKGGALHNPISAPAQRGVRTGGEGVEERKEAGAHFGSFQRQSGTRRSPGSPLVAMHSEELCPPVGSSEGGVSRTGGSVFVDGSPKQETDLFSHPFQASSSLQPQFSARPLGIPQLHAHRPNPETMASSVANLLSAYGSGSSSPLQGQAPVASSSESRQSLPATLFAPSASLTISSAQLPHTFPVNLAAALLTRAPVPEGKICAPSCSPSDGQCNPAAAHGLAQGPFPDLEMDAAKDGTAVTRNHFRSPSAAANLAAQILMTPKRQPEAAAGRETAKANSGQMHACAPCQGNVLAENTVVQGLAGITGQRGLCGGISDREASDEKEARGRAAQDAHGMQQSPEPVKVSPGGVDYRTQVQLLLEHSRLLLGDGGGFKPSAAAAFKSNNRFNSLTGIETPGPLLAFHDPPSEALSPFIQSTSGSAACPAGVPTVPLSCATHHVLSFPASGGSEEAHAGTTFQTGSAARCAALSREDVPQMCSSSGLSAALKAAQTKSRLSQLSREALSELVTREDMQLWVKSLLSSQEIPQEQWQGGLGVQSTVQAPAASELRRSLVSCLKEGEGRRESWGGPAGQSHPEQDRGDNCAEGSGETRRSERRGAGSERSGKRGGGEESRVLRGEEQREFLGDENFSCGNETRRTDGTHGHAAARGGRGKRGGNRQGGRGKGGRGRRGGLWEMMDDDIMDISTWTM